MPYLRAAVKRSPLLTTCIACNLSLILLMRLLHHSNNQHLGLPNRHLTPIKPNLDLLLSTIFLPHGSDLAPHPVFFSTVLITSICLYFSFPWSRLGSFRASWILLGSALGERDIQRNSGMLAPVCADIGETFPGTHKLDVFLDATLPLPLAGS